MAEMASPFFRMSGNPPIIPSSFKVGFQHRIWPRFAFKSLKWLDIYHQSFLAHQEVRNDTNLSITSPLTERQLKHGLEPVLFFLVPESAAPTPLARRRQLLAQ